MTIPQTVLVVDDEALMREVINTSLRSAGYNVLPASSGREAFVEAHAHGDPDMAILDIVMPDMDGREVGKWMRAAYPRVKLLFISGHPQGTLSNPGVLGPEAAFLQKPFRLPQLVEAVANLLNSSAGTN